MAAGRHVALITRIVGGVVLMSTVTAVLALLPPPIANAGPSTVVIDEVRFDPKDSAGETSELNSEFIVLRNAGNVTADLTGWKVQDEDGIVYEFAHVALAAGMKVTIRTGGGVDTGATRYWHRGQEVWDNDGGRAILLRRSGAIAGSCRYRGKGSSVICLDAGNMPSSAGLQDAIDQRRAGTTFALSGHFHLAEPIVPEDGDAFFGPAVLSAASGNLTGFDAQRGEVDHLKIVDVEMFGFGLRAIRCWDGTVVRKSNLHENLRNGVGCGNAVNVVIAGNEIHHNGSDGELMVGSSGIKMAGSGGQGRGPGTVVRGNYVHDNIGNGIWFDVDSGNDVIVGNVVKRNSYRGVFYEVSRGPAVIRGNIVKRNNLAGLRLGSGIGVTSSMSVTVEANVLGSNRRHGVRIGIINRGYRLDRVVVRANDLNDDRLTGCPLAGVRCEENR